MENSFTTSMTRRYLFALSVLALVAIVSDYVLQKKINAEQSRAAVVNISGQQRLLSQRLTFFAMRLVNSRSPGERGEWRRELAKATQFMESSIEGLLHGDPAMNLPGHPSPEIRALYFSPPHSLHERMQKFLAVSKALAQAPERELAPDNSHLQYLSSTSAELLDSLNEVVKQHQKESEAGIAQLQKLERTVLVITIFVLLMMALFIFRPMVKRLQVFLVEREQAAAEREKLIAELQAALASVKTLSGLIPICASCKKIRDDKGYWNKLEDYIGQHSNADFTHGFCPECQIKFELSEG
jgi:hypothetical protein